jgi:predicted nucleic acid-binding protein
MKKVFVDTDVCIDLLSGRKPFHLAAQKLFSQADRGTLKIYVSSISFANIDYLLRKEHTGNGSRQILAKFKTLVQVIAVDDKCIELAIASNFSDFEDAIQNAVAMKNGITTFITRNTKDFKKSSFHILTPETFLAKEPG